VRGLHRGEQEGDPRHPELLQAIADKSEMRQYKIQRRIKDV